MPGSPRISRSRRRSCARGYDQYEDHKANHERLLDETRDIMDRHEADAHLDVEPELATHLRERFTAHFKTKDARLHEMLG